jgi:hypothetical protein
VLLPEGLDFIMRPVLRGMCSYESAVSGALDICDFADMNDAIDALDENTFRAQEASKGK